MPCVIIYHGAGCDFTDVGSQQGITSEQWKGSGEMEDKWVICPVCGSKTRVKIREDTVLKNFPLFCPKCKHESTVNAEKLQVTVQSK